MEPNFQSSSILRPQKSTVESRNLPSINSSLIVPSGPVFVFSFCFGHGFGLQDQTCSNMHALAVFVPCDAHPAFHVTSCCTASQTDRQTDRGGEVYTMLIRIICMLLCKLVFNILCVPCGCRNKSSTELIKCCTICGCSGDVGHGGAKLIDLPETQWKVAPEPELCHEFQCCWWQGK